MERLIKFLKTQPDHRFMMEDDVVFALLPEDKIRLSSPEGSIISDDLYELQDWAEDENHFYEFRLCDKCGKPIRQLFMDCCDFYSCEDCFKTYMDELYEKGNWRSNPENEDGSVSEGECGGYYEYCENDVWKDTGIFWTELT